MRTGVSVGACVGSGVGVLVGASVGTSVMIGAGVRVGLGVGVPLFRELTVLLQPMQNALANASSAATAMING